MSTDAAGPLEVRSNDGLGPLPARWYMVSRDGLATLCASEENAREMAAECARDYPRQAPYRAVMLGDVAAERERIRRALLDMQAACTTHNYYAHALVAIGLRA